MSCAAAKKVCLDIATDNCPCSKAYDLECPACGFLNQHQHCNCSDTWEGLCIFQHLLDYGLRT